MSYLCHPGTDIDLGGKAFKVGVSYLCHPGTDIDLGGRTFGVGVSDLYQPSKENESGVSFPFHLGEDIAIGVTSCTNPARTCVLVTSL